MIERKVERGFKADLNVWPKGRRILPPPPSPGGVDPKKLGSCTKDIEYRHFSSRVCFFGEKHRRPVEDAGKVL